MRLFTHGLGEKTEKRFFPHQSRCCNLRDLIMVIGFVNKTLMSVLPHISGLNIICDSRYIYVVMYYLQASAIMHLNINCGSKDSGFRTYSWTTCCWDRQASGAPLADSAWAVWTAVVRRPGVAGPAGPTGTGRPPVVVGRKHRKSWPWRPGSSKPVPRCSTTIWKSL